MPFTFEAFEKNVQQWSMDRQLYKFSTVIAQALKTDAECGELSDAVIKNDLPEVKDGIGDVAVCVINVAYLSGIKMDWGNYPKYKPASEPGEIQKLSGNLAYHVGMQAAIVSGVAADKNLSDVIQSILGILNALATSYDLSFIQCCEHAWNEIKDRKGRMVEGGAFVKE